MIYKTHKILALSAFTAISVFTLTACGGGSDSADSSNGAPGIISKACSRSGNNVSVTQEGCLTAFGNNTQTVACSGSNTLMTLTGTGLTLNNLIQGGSKTTAGNGQFGFNEVSLRCI